MSPQNEKPHDFGVIRFEHFTNGEKITQRFRHFFIIDTHEAVVHPIVDKWLTTRALGLSDFIFMVRKLKILATAMNIKMLTQQLA